MYGDPRGLYWVVYMECGKCMGTLRGHRGDYIRFGKSKGTIRGRLYEVWEVYGKPRGS